MVSKSPTFVKESVNILFTVDQLNKVLDVLGTALYRCPNNIAHSSKWKQEHPMRRSSKE